MERKTELTRGSRLQKSKKPNSLETKIENMQEMFNKDLEEIKKESVKNE